MIRADALVQMRKQQRWRKTKEEKKATKNKRKKKQYETKEAEKRRPRRRALAINTARLPTGNTGHVPCGLFENDRDETVEEGRGEGARSDWFGSRRLQAPVKISLATSYIGTCRLLRPASAASTKFRIPLGSDESRA